MIEESVLERVLGEALRRGGDLAEVFAEDRRSTSARLDDGRVEELTSGRDRGAGIRVVVGDGVGFAHTADLSEPGLLAAAAAASAAARGSGGEPRTVALDRSRLGGITTPSSEPPGPSKADKVELLRRADHAARAASGAIRQVGVTYGDGRRRVLVANSDGLLATDETARTRLAVQVVASGDAGMQTGFESVASTVGFELFDESPPEEVAGIAARRALVKLAARPAPSGTLPVVLAKGSGGVLFHEACGHGLEADLVAKGASVFAGRRGERVASPLVTLVDDGTVSEQWGTSAIDDEGHPASRNVLIEDGVLTGYMRDLLRARGEGGASSGNGRRQSYRHLPMVRMTNTFLLAGEDEPDDIVASTERGVFVARLGGGQVNTATGDFVFGMAESYLIENGVITAPLREGNLIGNGPEVLRAIDAVGRDFALSPGGGTCGKDGQGVPVGLGQPTLRVAAITVGGTAR
ncbi:MAG TPA: TldD/PmbA family protein [Acidimicrobiales bacterium]|nr:TldD/PmbA family protein [Acidimicrobiales bacterium]